MHELADRLNGRAHTLPSQPIELNILFICGVYESRVHIMHIHVFYRMLQYIAFSVPH